MLLARAAPARAPMGRAAAAARSRPPPPARAPPPRRLGAPAPVARTSCLLLMRCSGRGVEEAPRGANGAPAAAAHVHTIVYSRAHGAKEAGAGAATEAAAALALGRLASRSSAFSESVCENKGALARLAALLRSGDAAVVAAAARAAAGLAASDDDAMCAAMVKACCVPPLVHLLTSADDAAAGAAAEALALLAECSCLSSSVTVPALAHLLPLLGSGKEGGEPGGAEGAPPRQREGDAGGADSGADASDEEEDEEADEEEEEEEEEDDEAFAGAVLRSGAMHHLVRLLDHDERFFSMDAARWAAAALSRTARGGGWEACEEIMSTDVQNSLVSILRLREEADEDDDDLERLDSLARLVLDLLSALAESGDEEALARTEGFLDVLTSLMSSSTVADEAAGTLAALLYGGGGRTIRALTADNLSSLARCLDSDSMRVASAAALALWAFVEGGGHRGELIAGVLPAMLRRLKSKRANDHWVLMFLIDALGAHVEESNGSAEAVAAGAPDALVAALADAAAGAWGSNGFIVGMPAARSLRAILKARREAEADGPLLSPRSLETLLRLAAGEVEVEQVSKSALSYPAAAKSILADLE